MNTDPFLKLRGPGGVTEITSLSPSTIYRLIQDGDPPFPKPTKITPMRSVWRRSAVLDWMAQIEERGQG